MAAKQYAAVLDRMDPELRQIIEGQKKRDRLVRPTKENVQFLRPAFDASSARWQKSPIIAEAISDCRKYCPWEESLTEIPCRDGHQMRAEIYRPVKVGGTQNDKMPCILLVHGGGICMGGLGTDKAIGQVLCSRLKAVVVSIEYRMIPDFAFDVPSKDAYDAASWIQLTSGKKNHELCDVDLEKGFVACGPSGGGNILATVMLGVAEDMETARAAGNAPATHIPRLSGIAMLMTGFPVEVMPPNGGRSLSLYPDLRPSWKECEEAPIMNKWVNPDYTALAEECDVDSHYFSLLHVPPKSALLDHFPKRWYHETAGLDMWHDTALLWLSILLHDRLDPLEKNSRVHFPSVPNRPSVKVDHYPGLPHTWWSVYPQIGRTRQWIEDLVKGVAWALANDAEESSSYGGDLAAKL